jgi:phosphoribosyl-AMP cyclohydrolase
MGSFPVGWGLFRNNKCCWDNGCFDNCFRRLRWIDRIPLFRPPRALFAVSHPAPKTIPDFEKGDGLLPAIAQDAATGDVLMMAYMNPESYAETLATGRAVYFSRSRNKLWRKGEESGNVQLVRGVYVDCDADTILLKVEQLGGAACHEGYRSCFFREVTAEGLQTVGERVFDPTQVYGKK